MTMKLDIRVFSQKNIRWLIHAVSRLVELLNHQAMHKRAYKKISSLLSMRHLHIAVALESQCHQSNLV